MVANEGRQVALVDLARKPLGRFGEAVFRNYEALHRGAGGAAMLISRISRRISNSTVGRPQPFRDFPAPIRSETGTMPTDDGIGPHDRQRLDGFWHQTIQPNKDQAIHGTEGHPLRHMPSLYVKLMTKNQDLASNETRDRNNKISTDQARL
jgi:hypothetical protein